MKIKMLALAAVVTACCAFRVVELSPTPEGAFAPGGGGKLVAVEAFAPTNGTVSLKRVWATDLYTNATVLVTNATGSLTVSVWSNVTTHAVYTNTVNSLRGVSHAYPYSAPAYTNILTTVTPLADVSTNAVRGLWKTVAVTNSVVSGSASESVYSGAPANATYISPSEKLLFDGTARGGFLRLVFE